MEHVFNAEYGIVIVDETDEDEEFPRFLVYVEGVWMGTAFDLPEVREMAEEVLASLEGEGQEEEPTE